MLDRIIEKSPAKLNLFLKIISKRKDGFHNIRSGVTLINLFDEVIAEKDVKVEIDILEVKVAQEKVLDDNLAKSMGAKDLNDFKDRVKKQMQEELDNNSIMILKKNLKILIFQFLVLEYMIQNQKNH